ncbi:hypothetical protein BUALT_Bualt10G0012900 [Buddleja alternifolia]|uniref:Transcription factor MYB39 n=1 Tax=Buddleja alternifolia TaxID=168488 RepID=A0AAV6WUE5_9LAMI|nr:hypothetical protein BUALT_Bualt10G0012900 [Buddleja alternifolia]
MQDIYIKPYNLIILHIVSQLLSVLLYIFFNRQIEMRSPSNRDIDLGLKKGPWTPEEDQKLIDYIHNHGQCSWQLLPKKAGLNRCGKSCRLRWTNYLRPDIKRGDFSPDEEQTIIDLHSVLGNKWSMIATRLPGRTDNEIKNFWNTHLRKRLLQSGIDPKTHKPITDFNLLLNLPPMLHTSNLNNLMNNPILENLTKIQLLFNTLQVLNSNSLPTLNQIEGHFNGILNPLQVSSMGRNVETIEPFSCGYQPIFDTFGTIQGLSDSENNGIISNKSKAYKLPALVNSTTPEASDINSFKAPDYNELLSSNNYGDIWGEIMDDQASSSCWKDVFNESSFPAASSL